MKRQIEISNKSKPLWAKVSTEEPEREQAKPAPSFNIEKYILLIWAQTWHILS
jgi:hypothetical protein